MDEEEFLKACRNVFGDTAMVNYTVYYVIIIAGQYVL